MAEGFLADLILVDGDPLDDITVLQDPDRIVGIMKDGAFHKDPERAASAGDPAPAAGTRPVPAAAPRGNRWQSVRSRRALRHTPPYGCRGAPHQRRRARGCGRHDRQSAAPACRRPLLHGLAVVARPAGSGPGCAGGRVGERRTPISSSCTAMSR
ncbi:hypothetical protein ACU686_27930 [Yinghuangia aomiensis]